MLFRASAQLYYFFAVASNSDSMLTPPPNLEGFKAGSRRCFKQVRGQRREQPMRAASAAQLETRL